MRSTNQRLMTAEISTRQEVKLRSATQDATSTSSSVIMGMGEKKTYTLTYLDMKGRAEPIRMLFALAGVKFTDKRVTNSEWEVLKPTTPFGKLPILEISDGLKKSTTLHQSHSIMRHLAREFGLDGRSSLDKAKVDIITETMIDAIEPITAVFNETNEETTRNVVSEYSEGLLPQFLDYLTENLNEEWFLDQISLADITIYVAFDNIRWFVPDFLQAKSYWKLQDWKARFESHPKIAEWLANRPDTMF